MAYVIKYRSHYKDVFDTDWRIDIELDNYTGSIIDFRTVSKEACTIEYDLDEDKYEPIVPTSVSVAMYNEGQIDVTELQEAGDKDFRVTIFKNSTLQWQGYLVPDGIDRIFAAAPYTVNITATDGLMLLDGIDFSLQNMTVPSGISVRCPMNHIREILYRTQNLGIILPIRFAHNVECTAFPGEDAMWGSVEWSPQGEGYETFSGERRSCLWILENILKSFQCRIYQSGGLWNITRVNDIVTGVYDYTLLSATTGEPVVTTGTVDVNKTVTRGGDFAFINEDQLISVKPGVKSVKTTYNVDIGENIVPNGGFEYASSGTVLNWVVNPPSDGGFLSQAPPLRDNSSSNPSWPDRSLKVDATFESSDATRVNLTDGTGERGVPIDTKFFPRMNLSFLFSIETGQLGPGDNLANSFYIEVKFINDDGTYYLNNYGYWTTTVGTFSFDVPNYQLGDIGNIDFRIKNETGQINLPVLQSGGQPKELTSADEQYIYIRFYVLPGTVMYFDDVRISVDNNNDVWEAEQSGSNYTQKDERELQISSSYNGFMTTSYRTSWANTDDEFHFTDGVYTGSLTAMNSHAILRNNHLASKVFNGSIYGPDWSYGNILEIQTLEGRRFQQTRAQYNTETGITNITAIETRNDAIAPAMKHYGTNDDIFSSYGSV